VSRGWRSARRGPVERRGGGGGRFICGGPLHSVRRIWVFGPTFALLVAAAFLAIGSGGARDAADWAFRGGTILTLEGDAGGPAQAMAVRGERIVFVGDSAGLGDWIGPETRVVDLRGGTLTPGLVDSHFHLINFGKILRDVNLIGTKSWDEALARVAERARAASDGEWILGRGWDQNDWAVKEYPTRAEIDSLIPGRLVFLKRIDGHAALVSGALLERAGIGDETPDPPGGRILRDAGGRATGVLIDNAVDAAAKLIPEPSIVERESLLVRVARECVAVGLTDVHDMSTSEATIRALEDLDRKNLLPLRVHSYIDGADSALLRLLEAGPKLPAPGGRLTVRGVKIELDGALGSRGAALLAPYSDDPERSGYLRMDVEAYCNLMRLAWERGFQVATHSIGDRANRIVLDCYESLITRDGPGADRRPRIEHAQHVAPEEIPRFGALGVIASMQPTHATSDMYWAETRVGADRIAGAYAWRSLASAGARLAFGSDCPVESHDPRLGLYAAVTRQDAAGWPEGGWRPAERLTALEALEAFTSGAAYAAFEEGRLGTLRLGKEADFVFLSANPLAVEAAELPKLRVVGTWVGGELVYGAPGSEL